MRTHFVAPSALFLILASTTTLLRAQDPEELKTERIEAVAQKMTDQMATRLDLTPGQVTQVHGINLTFAQKAAPIVKGSGSKRSKLQALKPLGADRDSALQQVLSADQMTAFRNLQQENRKRMKQRYKARHAGG